MGGEKNGTGLGPLKQPCPVEQPDFRGFDEAIE